MSKLRNPLECYKLEYFVSLVPDGETLRFDHEDCPAGTDTRQRLYITRKEDGTVLAYCHNCQGSYYYRDRSLPNIWTNKSTELAGPEMTPECWHSYIESIDIPLYTPLTSGMASLEVYHHQYINKYELDMDMLKFDRWGVISNGWMWPVYDSNKMVGFQNRWLDGREPKVCTTGKLKGILHIINPHDSPVCVICEDRCSGVRIAQVGYAACVLHGSYAINAADAHKLSLMFDKFVVWYDNDNETVRQAAYNTVTTLRMFIEPLDVKYVMDLTDPKNYPDLANKVYLDGLLCKT